MRRDHDSNWRHLWLGLPLLIVLAFVEGSGRLRFGQARVAPDLVLSVVIAWAFLTDSVHGAIWGFVGGLALDGIATTPFPLYTVALTAAGIAVGVGRLSLYADDRVWGSGGRTRRQRRLLPGAVAGPVALRMASALA